MLILDVAFITFVITRLLQIPKLLDTPAQMVRYLIQLQEVAVLQIQLNVPTEKINANLLIQFLRPFLRLLQRLYLLLIFAQTVTQIFFSSFIYFYFILGNGYYVRKGTNCQEYYYCAFVNTDFERIYNYSCKDNYKFNPDIRRCDLVECFSD